MIRIPGLLWAIGLIPLDLRGGAVDPKKLDPSEITKRVPVLEVYLRWSVRHCINADEFELDVRAEDIAFEHGRSPLVRTEVNVIVLAPVFRCLYVCVLL